MCVNGTEFFHIPEMYEKEFIIIWVLRDNILCSLGDCMTHHSK